MSREYRVVPGRGQSIVGFIMGLFFVIIGCTIAIPNAGPFGILWTIIAAIIAIVNAVNAFSKRGVSTNRVIVEDSQDMDDYVSKLQSSSGIPKADATRTPAAKSTETVEQRLDKAYKLYSDGRITKEEYDKLRENILKSI